jgi:hydrogenase 3 maturation protease
MQNLALILSQKLQTSDKTAILGIGSYLRGDDAAGIVACEEIKKHIGKSPKLKVMIGATAPENLTGEIINFKPSHLIIIDSANLNLEPGEIKIINPLEIEGSSFSTHSLPLKVMIDYLRMFFECEFIFVGIQPKNIDMGNKLSKEVNQAIRKFVKIVTEIFTNS